MGRGPNGSGRGVYRAEFGVGRGQDRGRGHGAAVQLNF